MEHQVDQADVPAADAGTGVSGDVERLGGGADAQDVDLIERYVEEANGLDQPDHRRAVGPDAAVDVARPAVFRKRCGGEIRGCRGRSQRDVYGRSAMLIAESLLVSGLQQKGPADIGVVGGDHQATLGLAEQPVAENLAQGELQSLMRVRPACAPRARDGAGPRGANSQSAMVVQHNIACQPGWRSERFANGMSFQGRPPAARRAASACFKSAMESWWSQLSAMSRAVSPASFFAVGSAP